MFKRDTYRTPKQRADKAKLNIAARLGGSGLLIYFVVQLLTAPAEDRPDATTATIVSVIFLLVSAFVIFLTVYDLIIGIRTGRFKASTYEEMELAELIESKDNEVSCNLQEAPGEADDERAAEENEEENSD
ncbi:MAG: hypothetical protein GXY05_11890 [Clostridiales bacterium]|nr:hypothetical protein [Clostridiales bacterium]